MRGKGGSAAASLAACLSVSLLLAPGAQAAFPGQNGKIAFARGGDIYTIEADGSGLQQLTTTGDNSEPAWSGNGRRIAFTSTRDGDAEIYVMAADGSGQAQLTNDPASETHPAWSPDGTQIAFERYVPGAGLDVAVMRSDGSSSRIVTGGVDPVWSPDGQRIAFIAVNNITLVNPDGTDPVELTRYPIPTRDSHVNSYDPNWSPDGRWIAYERIGGNGPQFFYSLQVVSSDGTADRTAYLEASNGEGTWSPDGSRMVVEGSNGLHLLDVAATDFSTLPPATYVPGTSYADHYPDWQPLVPGPQRQDYRNGAHYCKALERFLGGFEFSHRYRSFGRCVSENHGSP